jgi:hypothetical protein
MEEACDRLHEQQRIAHDQPCRESEEAHEVGADPPLLRSERRTDVGRDRHVQTPATRTMPRVTRRSDQRLGPQLAEDAADLRVMYGIHAKARSYLRSHLECVLRSSAV